MGKLLKIGLITDGEYVSKYDAQLLEWVQQQPNIAITHLIIQDLPAKKMPQAKLAKALYVLSENGVGGLLSILLWNFMVRVEIIRLARQSLFSFSMEGVCIRDKVPHQIKVQPLRSKSGLVHRFSDEDVEAIEREKFDLLIRCGSGILKGKILHCVRLGILSFHHGDNRINRGGPAGFWEVFHRQKKTGFVIQKLTEELDGGDVVMRGFFCTQGYFLLNHVALLEKSTVYLKLLLLRIAAIGELPPAEAKYPYTSILHIYPKTREMIAYILKTGIAFGRQRVRALLRMEDRWVVAYSHKNWRDVALWRGKVLENPKGRFLADPFIVKRDGRHCILVEEYDYAAGRGHISAYEIDAKGHRFLGVALDEPFHLSFPYVFEYEGQLYMCPESSSQQDIRIYKCVEFPLKWELAAVAMKDVSAVDTMIFEKDGLWWMFTNLCRGPLFDHSEELHLFWAENPLAETWCAHALNPIYIDPERARNGGIIKEGSDIIRVSQSQGFDNYGASSKMFKVARLDKMEYEEEWLCDIGPDFKHHSTGTHHFHSDGEFSIWDFKTKERI